MPPVPPWMGVTPVPPSPFPPAPPYGDAKLSVDEEEGGEASFDLHYSHIALFCSVYFVQFHLFSFSVRMFRMYKIVICILFRSAG